MTCKSYIVILISLFLLFGCEYERIAEPDNECNPDNRELTIESVRNTACDEAIGEIVVSVSGDDEYEYRLNDEGFSSSNVFSELSAGIYTIQARILNSNCIIGEKETTIDNEDGIRISLVEKNDSECGNNTGSIIISQEDGTEPIQYFLNDQHGQSSSEFSNLASGSYTVLARDANGCEAEIPEIEIMTGSSFSNDIKSIISTNCAVSGCHNGSQPPNFSEDENIFQNASRIKSRTGSGTMPPAGRPDLTDEEIQSIACWVDDGALDN